MSLNDFPTEILLEIFSFLDFSSLKSAVLVCRRWRDIGEDPNLWKSMKMVEIHPEDIKNLLSITRLAKTQYLKICDWLANEHVKLLKSTNLKTLDISRCNLHEIEIGGVQSGAPKVELLSEVIVNIEVVNADRAVLSDEQWLAIFQSVCETSKIRTLIINSSEDIDDEDIVADLSHISPDLFAKAITFLETVQVAETCLTSEQLSALVKKINHGCKLKRLSLASNDISQVNSLELAKAFNRLEMLDLSGTNLGNLEDPNIFFKQMVKCSNLKTLDIGFNSFGTNNNRDLNPKLLAKALNTVEDLRLVGVDISAVQAQEFFKRMCVKTSIKKLQFEDNKYDMSLVNPNFMAAGLNKLSQLRMANSSINGLQCLEIFSRMAVFTKIQHLDFSFLDLCVVPAGIFSDAVNKVAEVILSDCCVTDEQTTMLFETISVSTNIKCLDLSLVPLEKIPHVVFANGARNLVMFRAVDSFLSKEQLELVLLSVNDNDNLKMLEVSHDDANVISEEVLEKTKLDELRVNEDYEYENFNYLQFFIN